MQPLENPQYEKFARLVASGKSYPDAFAKAGYTPDKKNANRLAQRPEVRDRIRELQDVSAKRIGATVEHVVRDLDAAYRKAMKLNQPAAAVGAAMGKAKILGLVIDRSETVSYRKPMREPTEVKRMSIEEWQAKFAPKNKEDAPQ